MISELYKALAVALKRVNRLLPGGMTLKKLEDFLYEVEYGSIDYEYARRYFQERGPVEVPGGCSVKRVGRYVLRLLDWKYDNEAVFVVRTPAVGGCKAVVGTVGSLSTLTVQAVESGDTGEAYRILPFYLQDGVNEDGLFAEMNVVPYSGTDRTVPLVEKTDSVCSLMLVRYILDTYSTVDQAIEHLRDHVEIFNPSGLTDMGYELHLLLADSNVTKVIEFAGGAVQVVESSQSTNFHLDDVDFEEDGSVLTPLDAASGNLPTSKGVDRYGSGLERWNILNRSVASDPESLRVLAREIRFSRAYTETGEVWHSEFVGQGDVDITVDTPADSPEFIERIEKYRLLWEARDRETAKVWITCHSCLYDLEKRAFVISVQERDEEHRIALESQALIKHIDLWNQNVEFIEEEQPWPRPAVFIEFGEINWSPLNGPRKLLTASCPVILHVVTDWKGSTAHGEPTREASVAAMDLSENISLEMLRMSGDSFHNVRLLSSVTNHNHEDIIESIERYSVTLERYI